MCQRPWVINTDCFKTKDVSYSEYDLRVAFDFWSNKTRMTGLSAELLSSIKSHKLEPFCLSYANQEVASISNYHFLVPCRKCQECLTRRALDYSVRVYCETLQHEDSCFLTLTYNDKSLGENHLDYTDKIRGPQKFLEALKERVARQRKKKAKEEFFAKLSPGLKKRDKLKLFYEYAKDKDFRNLTYFIAGEYGSQNGRMHWHALIFGWKPEDLEFHSLSHRGDKYFRSQMVDDLWSHGKVIIGDKITAGCALYVSRYIQKRWKPEDDIPEESYVAKRKRIHLADPKNKKLVDDENYPERCYFSKKLSKSWILHNLSKLLTDNSKITIAHRTKSGEVKFEDRSVPIAFYEWLKRLIDTKRKPTKYVRMMLDKVYSVIPEKKLREFFYTRFKKAAESIYNFDMEALEQRRRNRLCTPIINTGVRILDAAT